jgi:hypothetical protein
MKDIRISQFENICKDDFDQFREISKRFMKVENTNADELYQLTIDSWLLATRWSEIQSNASKIAIDNDANKTDFKDWAYQHYRQLQEMHITCRSWYRLAIEEMKLNNMVEGM